MESAIRNIDWTLLQSFAAVASEGSLSGAARRTGQSQPTVGRHVRALEAALGGELFTREPRGLAPTALGLALAEHAEAMGASAARLLLAAAGRSAELEGTVRLTASVVVSHFVLPAIIADLRGRFPAITVELVSSDSTENLIFREADIAIRMYRPTQGDVIARHVGDLPLGIYASKSYIARRGRPSGLADLGGHDFVGLDKSDLMIRAMAGLGMPVTRDFFPIRCDDQAAGWQMVRSGCGIGATQRIVGDADPLVERILPEVGMPRLPVWLAAPEALRTSARIRAVWDHLASELAARTAA